MIPSTEERWARARETRKAERLRAETEQLRYAERFPGWSKSATIWRCPRVVAGKQCRLPNGHQSCICQRYYFTLLDHVRLWNTPAGKVLTSEPYYVDPRALGDFRRDCAELGLSVTVEAYSPYFPGSTTLILVERIRA